MNPAPKDAQEPEEYGSAILLDSEGARLLAVAGEKTAVYLPAANGTVSRITIFDGSGNPIVDYPIEGTVTEGARTHADKASITWWTGSQTVNLRLSDLAPTWIVNGTSGPEAWLPVRCSSPPFRAALQPSVRRTERCSA